MKSMVTLVVFFGLLTACLTSTKINVPGGTSLEVYERPVTITDNGLVTVRPFFWTATAGVPYRLLKDGKVIEEGKLSARFRVVSIFWPPLAAIYWPIGFARESYDLTKSGAPGVKQALRANPLEKSTQ